MVTEVCPIDNIFHNLSRISILMFNWDFTALLRVNIDFGQKILSYFGQQNNRG